MRTLYYKSNLEIYHVKTPDEASRKAKELIEVIGFEDGLVKGLPIHRQALLILGDSDTVIHLGCLESLFSSWGVQAYRIRSSTKDSITIEPICSFIQWLVRNRTHSPQLLDESDRVEFEYWLEAGGVT